jgi:hypothetical protein
LLFVLFHRVPSVSSPWPLLVAFLSGFSSFRRFIGVARFGCRIAFFSLVFLILLMIRLVLVFHRMLISCALFFVAGLLFMLCEAL